jgi:anaerobic selenocysteine-containing dehydrogenase
MDRRRFIKVTAITGTSAALAGCGNPEHQLMRFVPEEEITPGIAVWKPSVCPLCSAGCGVQARVMDGDAEVFRNGQPGITRMGLPRKLEGDRDHPVSQGRLCVRGQAALQVTYHPDRLTAPLRRSGERGSGSFEEVSWDDALADLAGRIDTLVAQGQAGSIGFLGRPRRGRRPALVAEFLQRLGAPAPVAFEFFDDAVCRRANALSFGRYQLPTFDLARARYVIGFGADFLGTWNSPLAQNAAYGRMRGQQAIRTKFVQIEPRVSQTGASADEWLTVRPGTEGAVALGLAHVILRAGLAPASGAGRAGALVEGWAAGLPAFAPAEVEKRTGVAAARLEKIAHEFAAHRPSVAIIGGAGLAHANGLDQALAVNALNALVGSVEVPGGVTFMPTAIVSPPARSLRDLLAAVPATQLLLVDEANPVFAAPPAWKAAETLRRIPFIVSFGSFLDDTSGLADLVLPDHSFLEAWTESQPESGAAVAVATTAAPVMRPLYTTRAMPDVLLDVGRRLKQPLDPPLPWQSFEEMLQAPAAAAPAVPARPVAAASAPARPWTEPRFDGDAAEYPFHFLPYASQALYDGSLAHLPWLQELPDPMTTAMWSSWVELNVRTAESLGVADGDLVDVASAHGSVRAPVVISPGIGPDAVAMPVGQGHETFTRYASGRGANPIRVLAPVDEPETGTLAWAATRVKVTRVGGADGTLIRFAGATRERPDHHGRG